MNEALICDVCFHHCALKDGQTGFCGARSNVDGKIVPLNYGKLSSIALDPIEKKPLARFYPGSKILSIGSFGCNLHCPFCQNSEISWSKQACAYMKKADTILPEELLNIAVRLKDKGNIGIAFTYNEPLIGYEYVLDCAKLFHEAGMKCVLVSNGTAELPVLLKILPYIDAMNIDLKGFTDHFYSDLVKGDLQQVKAFLEEAAKNTHLEVTTLIIPDENDTEEEMKQISCFIASLHNGKDIPLHISRFFPHFHMQDKDPTPVKTVYRLCEVAREKLNFVYPGNC